MKNLMKWVLSLVLAITLVPTLPVKAESTSFGLVDPTNPNSNLYKYNAVAKGMMPCLGEAHALVFYVTFPDSAANWTKSPSDAAHMFFGTDAKNGLPTNVNTCDDDVDSLSAFYYRSSGGKLNITGNLVEYTTDNNAADYNSAYYVMKEIMDKYASTIDWSQYDANNDGYADAVYLVARTKPSWQSANNVQTFTHDVAPMCKFSYIYNCDVATIAHESCHLMGPPDMYGDVGLNPSGTATNSIMDGAAGDIPSPTKYVFGWLNPTYVTSTTDLTLSSFSDSNDVAIVFPNGDTTNHNMFFIEYLKDDRNNPSNGASGLRIWRTQMNLNENGNVNGSETFVDGFLNSPYDFLEALHPDDVERYLLPTGSSVTPYSNPNTAYSETFNVDGGVKTLKDLTFSGISISFKSVSSGKANVKVTINNTVDTTPIAANIETYDMTNSSIWAEDNTQILIAKISSSSSLSCGTGATLEEVNGSASYPLNLKISGSHINVYMPLSTFNQLKRDTTYRINPGSSMQTYYGANIQLDSSAAQLTVNNLLSPNQNTLREEYHSLYYKRQFEEVTLYPVDDHQVSFVYQKEEENPKMHYVVVDTSTFTNTDHALPSTVDSESWENAEGYEDADGIHLYSSKQQKLFDKTTFELLDTFDYSGGYLVGLNKQIIYKENTQKYTYLAVENGKYVEKEIKGIQSVLPQHWNNKISHVKDNVFIADSGNSPDSKKTYIIHDGQATFVSNIDTSHVGFTYDDTSLYLIFITGKDLVMYTYDENYQVTNKKTLLKNITDGFIYPSELKITMGNKLMAVQFDAVHANDPSLYANTYIIQFTKNGTPVSYYRYGDSSFRKTAESIMTNNDLLFITSYNKHLSITNSDSLQLSNITLLTGNRVSTSNYVSGNNTTWISSKPSVVKVENGQIVAVSLGTAVLSVYQGSSLVAEYSVQVTLNSPTVSAESLNGVTLTWTSVTGATAYNVYRKNGDTFEKISTTTKTTYVDRKVTSGQTYTYYVKATCTDSDGVTLMSGASNEASAVAVKPTTPTVSIVNTINTLNLSWDAMDGMSGYELYRSVDDDQHFTLLKTLTTTSYKDTTTTANHVYYYKIKPYVLNGSVKEYEEESEATSERPLPAAVTGLTYQAIDSSSATISWTAVKYASGYNIYKKNGESYELILSTSSLQATIDGLVLGQGADIAVRAYVADNEHESPTDAKIHIDGKVTTPAISARSLDTTQIEVSWNAIGSARYEVYRSTSTTSSSFVKVATVDTNSYIDTKFTPGKTYYYKVVAVVGEETPVKSSKSNMVTVKTSIAKTAILSISATNPGTLTLNLKDTHATYYYVYRATSKTGKYSYIGKTPEATYEDHTVKANKTYYYKVIAKYTMNGKTYSSSYCTYKSAKTILGTSKITSIAVTDFNELTIQFSPVANATSYIIQKSTYSTFKKYSNIYTTDTTYVDTSVSYGKKYYYRVIAVYQDEYHKVTSAKSKVVAKTAKLNTPSIVSALSEDGASITITINEVPGADSYQIQRSTTKDFKSVKTFSMVGNTYTDTTVVVNKTYYWRVRAVHELNGKSYYSSYSAYKTAKIVQ